jgi:PAS domain S-box-containing protein
MGQSLERNVIAGLIVVFLTLIANAVLSNQATNEVARNEELALHTRNEQSQIKSTLSTIRQAEGSALGYVITGDERYLEQYRQAGAEIDPALNRIGEMTIGNPRQRRLLATLRDNAQRSLNLLNEITEGRQRDGFTAAQALIMNDSYKEEVGALRRIVVEMDDEEAALLKSYDEELKSSRGSAQLIFGASTLISMTLVMLLGWALMRGLAGRKQAEEESRASEEFNRGILESAPDCINSLDLDGRLLSMNTPGMSLMEVEDFSPFEGNRWIDLWEGAARDAAQAAMETAKSAKTARFQGFCPTAKGTPKWWDVIVTPVRNRQGKVIKLLATSRDITALQEVETERQRIAQERARLLTVEQRARSQAEEANRIKDEFLANVSHELRTPLNAIMGWSNLLRSGNVEAEEIHRAFETIERNVAIQSRLIEDLLDVSRIISGKLRLERRMVGVVNAVEEALESVRPAAEAKQITIETNLGSQIEKVFADPARLQQIVWNLLSNAVKFTPKGGRIRIEIGERDSQIEIGVSDTGQGIDPDFLPYVFDRFRQAEGSLTRKHGGLGLGLAIVRHLVELHGGRVVADSPGEGQGATFTVSLPISSARRKAPLETVVPDDEEDNLLLGQAPSLEGVRVLVVDDEPDARDLLAVVLEQSGAWVTTADSAVAALGTLCKQPFDVLISDIQMPEVDGYELIRRLREMEAGRGEFTPAMALTAHVRSKDRARAFAAGFQMHVSKPVSAAELVVGVGSLAGAPWSKHISD